MQRVRYIPQDDPSCGWFHTSKKRDVKPSLTGDINAKWVIVGAGFTGLSIARRLAEHYPQDEIVLVEAQEVGFGPAGRNAGFAIDLPHDIGAEDYIGDLEIAGKTLKLNVLGQTILKDLVEKYQIDCQMSASGKYQAAVSSSGLKVLEAYQKGLDRMRQPYEVIDGEDLPYHLGTSFYKKALFTPGTILLQPSALVKGVADTLPDNVTLYENTAITGFQYGKKITLEHASGLITADQMILANNAFGMHFGYLKNSMLPVFLYASLTRELTVSELDLLGGKSIWGVIPADPFGSTVRKTADNRILIRNSFSFNPTGQPNAKKLESFIKRHEESFKRRFPILEDVNFEFNWSGSLGLSQNHKGFFGQLASNIYGAICCNGLGVTRGTATGALIADFIAGQNHELIPFLLETSGPNKLPMEPFLSMGVNARLWWGQRQAGLES
ncbi:FAD-binding oxidoreductase [Ignatzschineria rhizosphaerae]|uniref:FAD-binding oxidoreductase n=1 Tax=Ignatzschineria rhizosphaerae TaxID=2923279 RepID=A0ABY3X1M4_9GAMM|nr:FAD-binding oxidoreductase [Ignatzschineria rhizosphaerae]UNM96761.1 FAD-binding oxidoreductase [Ignatzschineria rhizosphaerae]